MSAPQPPFQDTAVEAAFAAFPEPSRSGLLALRALIFEIAEEIPGVGPLQETLKWSQPAYLTPVTRSGSTIRLGRPKQGGFALFTHCQTTILSDFRTVFPDDLDYEGNRAVRFRDSEMPPTDKMALLIRSALTYHCRRR